MRLTLVVRYFSSNYPSTLLKESLKVNSVYVSKGKHALVITVNYTASTIQAAVNDNMY